MMPTPPIPITDSAFTAVLVICLCLIYLYQVAVTRRWRDLYYKEREEHQRLLKESQQISKNLQALAHRNLELAKDCMQYAEHWKNAYYESINQEPPSEGTHIH